MSTMKSRTTLTIFLSAAVLASPFAAVAAKAKPAKAVAAAEVEAPVSNAVTVSDYEFNTFIFPDVVKRLLFPAGSPVVGKPIYLADNTQVMLQFSKGQDKPVQLVAELESGQTVSVRVLPRPIPGISHNVNGGRVRASAATRRPTGDAATTGSPQSADIEVLKGLVASNEPPSGYDTVRLPAPTRFDKFSVVPLAGWTNGAKRLLVFSLVAVPGQTAVVAPPQFYRPGITAVMLDGDVVDAENSPQLFVIEDWQDE